MQADLRLLPPFLPVVDGWVKVFFFRSCLFPSKPPRLRFHFLVGHGGEGREGLVEVVRFYEGWRCWLLGLSLAGQEGEGIEVLGTLVSIFVRFSHDCAQHGCRMVMLLRMAASSLLVSRSAKIKISILLVVFRRILMSGRNLDPAGMVLRLL
jgi:hypothetical protein